MASLSGLFSFKKSSVVKTIGIYTFTNFFTKGISFLLIPIFTNPQFLTKEDNGLLSLFSNASLFLMPFISLGLVQSTSTDFFKLSKKEFKDFFATGFFMSIIMTLVSVVSMLLLKDQLKAKYGFPESFVWIIPIITFLTFCSEQITRIIRNNDEPVKYLWTGVVKIVIELALAVTLIVFFSFGWYGRVIGMLVALTVIAVYALYYFIKRDYLFGAVKKKYIKSELIYALPIMLMQASIFIMSSSDKFFLANDREIVGVYSTACVFCSIIIVFSNALLQYFTPTIFSILSSPEADNAKLKKLFYYYTFAMLFCTILVVLGTTIFYKLFINEQYHSALKYTHYIAIGYFFWTITSLLYAFLLYYKQKKAILLFSALCIGISLLCNWFFITRYNDKGAAIAICCSYLITLILCMFFTKQHWQHFFTEKKINQSL